jgi:hypothetical protein
MSIIFDKAVSGLLGHTMADWLPIQIFSVHIVDWDAIDLDFWDQD